MKKYYVHKKTLWLYRTQKKYTTLEALIKGKDYARTPEELLKDAGLEPSDDIIILISANLGWNWEGEYELTTPQILADDYIEISKHAFKFFKEVKMEDNFDESIIESYVAMINQSPQSA